MKERKVMKKKLHYSAPLLRWLLGGIGALLVLHLIGQYIVRIIGTDSVFVDEMVWRFNVDLELNTPTWYASFLAGTASLVAFFVASQSKIHAKSVWTYRTWFLIALTFLFIAVDETASFHELLLQNLHIQAGFGEGQSYTENAWLLLLPFIVAAAAAAVSMVYYFLPKKTFYRFTLGIGLYLLGALVIEYISIPIDENTHIYNFFLTPLEEGLEMLGVWIMLRAMFLHIRDYLPKTEKKLRALWP